MTLRIDCAYSADWLSLGTQDPGVVEFVMSSPIEDSTLSVLLEDRAQVETLRNALSLWLGSNGPAQGENLPLVRHGLSYASWLTLPRVLMQAMPDEWQERAGVQRGVPQHAELRDDRSRY